MARVVVVGGGPVGLVAALYARRAGHAVTLFERRTPPIDKACGEGLMPGGVAALTDLGVALDPAGYAPFGGIRYFDGPVVADGAFPHGTGWGVRRVFLHHALVARAAAVGVDLRWGVAVDGLTPDGVFVEGSELKADLVIGADGLRSKVRGWAGLEGPVPSQAAARLGLRRHFAVAPWTDRVEVYWGDGAEAYVTPAGPERVGVAFLWSGDAQGGFEGLLARFPRLAERLAGGPEDSRIRGAGPLAQPVRGVLAGQVALVGDAAGYLDAITGEGLSLGFHQARALVDCFTGGRLAQYPARHRRIVRRPFALIRLLLWLRRHPRLRRRVMGAFARHPQAFGRLLALNDGAPLDGAALGAVLRLALGLARRPALPR